MDDKKKQIPLRISASLYGDLSSWAEDEFRSLNGQIEYLLTECVRKRKKGGAVTDGIDEDISAAARIAVYIWRYL